MIDDVKAALQAFCREHNVIIYANDTTHLVTVETVEGQELFSFGSANRDIINPT